MLKLYRKIDFRKVKLRKGVNNIQVSYNSGVAIDSLCNVFNFLGPHSF